ncbi:hypothetical protein SADUNF_Sadunf08G0048000 [Salix dunnii]|uniref:dihydrofolate reductase n=1 Tax=Salix dunnii TaxID=1413687 RepID=A0A835MS39_9ROSI|nr:hypothetical protein SADUNF_Sadunf08G0048000 [Salix dunnii]
MTRILDLARPKVLLNSSKSNFCKSMFLAATSLLFKIRVLTSNYKRFIVTSGEIPIRSYQVVVAATRDMGIGKDGRLPWRLPSDLKFFKEITLGTTDPVKQNAVLMGRKTWESIPIRHRPLPGRLNVVLTRSCEIKNEENVVTCGSISSALEMLAKAPYCFSIDKVFVIGGGQILRETLNGPRCDAIHITRIETSVECDTFIPSIDFSMFQPWYSSPLLVENGIQYSFVTYVHVRNSEDGTTARKTEGKCNDVKSNSNTFEVENFSFLPKMIFEKRDNLSIRVPEDQMAHDGSNFYDLDENLKKGFHKYLEIRGIKPSTTNFLHEYISTKTVEIMWDG